MSRATCLYLATKLGDLSRDVVVVGGLVPSLIVPQQSQHEAGTGEHHIGTMDVDLGLSLSLLNDTRYLALRDRLLEAKFKPDTNDNGNATPQRWVLEFPGAIPRGPGGALIPRTTVDFLIPAEGLTGAATTKSKFLVGNFAAQPAEGLQLAFQDAVSVEIQGETPFGERATRSINVCGPAAFVVLKALAFRNRGMNKDAYDLHYVVRWFGNGPQAVAERMRLLMAGPAVAGALAVLRESFVDVQATGPMRVAEFRGAIGSESVQVRADVVGDIRAFLSELSLK